MSEQLRVGVIGSGWAGNLHAEAFHNHVDTAVVALLARTPATAYELVHRVGDPEVFTDLEQFLEAGLDIVSIATPPDSHHGFALAAAARKLHLLCDKPVALTQNDARQILDAAEGAGVRHATGFIWRGDPGLIRLREQIAEGSIGEVTDVHVRCAIGAPILPMTWMYDDAAGGGALMQHGGHIIDRVRWLLRQEFVEVSGELLHDIREAEIGPRFHHVQEAFGWAPAGSPTLIASRCRPLPSPPIPAIASARCSTAVPGHISGNPGTCAARFPTRSKSMAVLAH